MLAGGDSIEDLAAVISEVSDCHFSHGRLIVLNRGPAWRARAMLDGERQSQGDQALVGRGSISALPSFAGLFTRVETGRATNSPA